jgi:sugar/nucleoside kinase (ribokinase family)
MKKILCMGNALTDILLQISDDAVLEKLNLPKGGMQLINADKFTEINADFDFSESKMVTGGSASNTANGISRLGGIAGFFGKVGRDEVGDFFVKDTLQSGVIPHLSYSKQKSGTCSVFVSKDGERTMCTFLGAACELGTTDLRPEMFRNYDIFHIEGYLVQNHDLIKAAVKLAKEEGLIVSIDLASYNIVEENLDFLQSIVADYVDIVFANEDEARAFTGKEPKEALIQIAEKTYIAVVKIGKEGSYVSSENNNYVVNPYTVTCVDTTGAGDLYAAGFLYGVACGLTLDKCGRIGSLVSSQVVEVLGAKMPDARWDDINHKVSLIES